MTPSQLAALRKRFEALDFSAGLGTTGSNVFHENAGLYASDKTQWRFEGYKAAQPDLLELRDKLVGEMKADKCDYADTRHPEDLAYNNAVESAIQIINAAFSPYVKGE